MLEFPNGQIQFKLKEQEKKMRESKSLKTMKLVEDKWMQKKNRINKSSDKLSLIRPTNNSMITKIWLRPFIAKCFYAMLPLSSKLRENLSKEKKLSTKKLTFNGKSSRNKKWPSMMKDSEKSSKKNTTKR